MEALNKSRATRMRATLDRVAEVATEKLGVPIRLGGGSSGARVPEVPGRVVPDELIDLYSIADSVDAFGITIEPPGRLQLVTEYVEQLNREYELHPAIASLVWGPRPLDDYIAVGSTPYEIFVSQVAGDPGGVTVHDPAGEQGFYRAAPTLQAMFEAWLVVVNAVPLGYGYGEDDVTFVITDVLEPDANYELVRQLVADVHCTPAAVGILEGRPSRRHAT